MKKIIKLLVCSVLLVLCSIGITSSDKNIRSVESSDEVIDSIVNLAIEEIETKIDDYVDINYFVNLQESTSMMVDNIQLLSTNVENEQISNQDIDEIQYETLTTSIINIFDDLTDEEYKVFKTLGEDDSDIAEMLELIECDFETKSIVNESNSSTIKAANIVTLSTGVLEIGTILSMQNVCSAAIVAIKGAFNSMIATIKAFFIPNSVKAIVITASILVISTVVIVNWNKIKPVFNQIVNIFLANGKKLANTVRTVFNQISNIALSSEANSITNAVFNDDVKYNMGKYGLTSSMIASLLKEFTGIDINNKNNSDDRTVYLGCVEDLYYKYALNDYTGISFHVSDMVWNAYASKYTTAGLWLVNYAFLNYVIYKRWEIVLVTNPAIHYNLYTQSKLTTRMYASELEMLCKFNGGSWHYEGPFWRIDKAW